MRGKFREERRYVKHLVKKSPEKTDNRAVNKRHEQRSEADTDKFSEKQQRHRTANGKTRQIKASLEKRPFDLEFCTHALNEKVIHLRIEISLEKAGDRERSKENSKYKHDDAEQHRHTAGYGHVRVEDRQQPP